MGRVKRSNIAEKTMSENLECLELGQVDEVAVVKFRDKKVMDPSRIEQMGKELLEVIADDDNERMLINFDNVSFFSSAAINKLIVLEKQIRAKGGKLRLCNLRPEVRDLFSYTSLDQMFEIDQEQVESIQALSQ
jgi:anti-anti-sigma factor